MKILIALPCGNIVRCRFDLLIPKDSMKYFPFPWRIAFCTSVLKKHGYDVRMIDGIAEELTRDEFVSRFRDIDPDLVVWETTAASFEHDIETMNELKKVKPNVLVAASGYFATPMYKKCLDAGYDYVVVGEADYSVLDLVRYLNGELKTFPKGVATRGQKLVPRPIIENLDELPWPERDDLPMEKYNDPKLSGFNVVLISSRGCIWGCSFCYVPAMYGKVNYRTRSPKDVVDEMEFLLNKYDINELYLDDDNFGVNKEHVAGICNEIIKRGLKFNWNCMCDAKISYETLSLMRDAGCSGITIGGESADDDVLKHMEGKPITRKDIEDFVENCKELGIRSHITWVLGMPYSTKESDMETVRFAIDLPSDSLQFTICTPQPGTKMYEWCEKNNYLTTTDWEDFLASDKCVIDQPGYSHEEVEEVHGLAGKLWYRKMLFRNPGMVGNHLHNLYRYYGLGGMVTVALKSIRRLI